MARKSGDFIMVYFITVAVCTSTVFHSGEKMKIIEECIVIVPESCSALLLAPALASGCFWYSGEKIKMI